MRRGLKPRASTRIASWCLSFKPIPDEEGTETREVLRRAGFSDQQSFKPIPDEEGTETCQSPCAAFMFPALQTDPR